MNTTILKELIECKNLLSAVVEQTMNTKDESNVERSAEQLDRNVTLVYGNMASLVREYVERSSSDAAKIKDLVDDSAKLTKVRQNYIDVFCAIRRMSQMALESMGESDSPVPVKTLLLSIRQFASNYNYETTHEAARAILTAEHNKNCQG
jgi:hypothetical protein